MRVVCLVIFFTHLRPSDTCWLIACDMTRVSAESLLTNSPVLFLSKNATSCREMELKREFRRRAVMRCDTILIR